MEVKKQVVTVLIVIVREFGKMVLEKRGLVSFNDIFVERAGIDLAIQKTYLRNRLIMEIIKYAPI